MIKYKIEGKALPGRAGEEKVMRYYPQIALTSASTVEHVIRRISARTTITSSEVRAVIDALEHELIDMFQHGQSVRLGQVGSFRPVLLADSVETAAEAKEKGAELIRKVKIIFTESTEMSKALRKENLEFRNARDLINAKDETDDS